MKISTFKSSRTGSSRPLVLTTAGFVFGAALTGAWFYHQAHSANTNGGLPVQTRNLLGHLDAPVSLRFYSLLPKDSADAATAAYAERVGQLLAAMQTAGGGQITVTTFDTVAETNAAAAAADGVRAFNLDKGDACYLGIAVSSGAKKESLARLQPEWESALPYDLARTILRVSAAAAPAPAPPEVAKPSAEIVSSIQNLIPDPSTVTVQQADQIFHAEFLRDCAALSKEVDADMATAQKRVVDAQASGSAAELDAARKNLLKVQLDSGEKMKRLAADLQTRLAVFQQMKEGTKLR